MTGARRGRSRGAKLLIGLVTLLPALLAGCGEASLAESYGSRERYVPQFDSASVSGGLVARAWLEAAQTALAAPHAVELPYTAAGVFGSGTPGAAAIEFNAAAGQILNVALTRSTGMNVPAQGRLDVELFLVERSDDGERNVLLDAVTADAALDYQYRLPARAAYVVRVRPEPLAAAIFRVVVELDAALPFPVRGRRDGDVASFFGDARDAGARHHEGVDIFAPRLTPVIAVADGDATPRENRLGGNTVWLSTPGVSYYYAHLERSALASGQRVRAGDVLGYVGNSGNAESTPPHLHFGIYRWGKGAVDPLPLLQARRFGPDADPDTGAASQVIAESSRSRAGRCGDAPARYPSPAPSYRACRSLSSLGALPGALPAAACACRDGQLALAGDDVGGEPLAPLDLTPLPQPAAPLEPRQSAASTLGIVATGVVFELAAERSPEDALCETRIGAGLQACATSAPRRPIVF